MTPEMTIGSDNECHYRPLRMEDIEPRTMRIVEEFIESISDLPIHVHEILKIVSDIESDAKEITKIAASDPVMVLKILTAVNSAYFGLPSKIDDLHHAIVLLGYREIRKMAIQSGFSHALKCMYDTRELWRHSYLVSLCAEVIALPVDRSRVGVQMTVGILHDIGKFVLCNPVLSTRIQRGRPGGTSGRVWGSSVEKEDLTCGINHAVVGKLLSMKWNLSDTISSTLEHHHYPSFYPLDMIPVDHLKEITVTCIADLMVNHMCGLRLLQAPGKEYFNILGLQYPLEDTITEELRKKLEKAKSFLLYIE